MTPSVIPDDERLPGDLTPDSPEYERNLARYREEVARVAKLRQYEARLPEAIRDADARVRALALRLGLKSATPAPGGERRLPAGESRQLVAGELANGPATLAHLTRALGLNKGQVQGALYGLRDAGLVEMENGYGAPWRLVEATTRQENA